MPAPNTPPFVGEKSAVAPLSTKVMVFRLATREPVTVWSIDARELLASGEYVRELPSASEPAPASDAPASDAPASDAPVDGAPGERAAVDADAPDAAPDAAADTAARRGRTARR